MKSGLAILLANVPTMLCAIIGGLLADRGLPWFGAAFLVLAYALAHTIRNKDNDDGQ